MAKKFVPQLGDVIWVTWVDINEATLTTPEQIKPDHRRTKEIFLGWRSAVYGTHTVDYLLCSRGDESLATGESYGGCAYPKGCILSISQYKSRKAGEGIVGMEDTKSSRPASK